MVGLSIAAYLISNCNCHFAQQGDDKAGFSIFWADDGLDTGPILLQKTTDVQPNDTVDSLYNRFMFPEGDAVVVVVVVTFHPGYDVHFVLNLWLF